MNYTFKSAATRNNLAKCCFGYFLSPHGVKVNISGRNKLTEHTIPLKSDLQPRKLKLKFQFIQGKGKKIKLPGNGHCPGAYTGGGGRRAFATPPHFFLAPNF